MISEGTDIPRQQVCCHLSRIRTELHYRQVLGRVLRRMPQDDEEAWLFVLAEQTLIALSERIAEDLPGNRAVLNHVRLPIRGVNGSGYPDTLDSEGISYHAAHPL